MINKQHHSKVLLNSFPMNGHTLELCPWNQKLENFVSPKVSLWQSKREILSKFHPQMNSVMVSTLK